MGGENKRVRKAVCLISGGLDSTVAAFVAKSRGFEVHALSFDYGQRHMRKELSCARKVAAAVEAVEHRVIEVDLGGLGGSALTDRKIGIPKAGGAGIPRTYVPARNTILLSCALAYAEVVDADAIYMGVNAVDYSGYPDCRPEYIKAFQRMADLATKRAVEGKPVKIRTPLIDLSKKEIVELGARLGVPFKHTWSCYRGGKRACGGCDSCVLRLKGFEEAGIKDPIEYESGGKPFR